MYSGFAVPTELTDIVKILQKLVQFYRMRNYLLFSIRIMANISQGDLTGPATKVCSPAIEAGRNVYLYDIKGNIKEFKILPPSFQFLTLLA